MSHPRIEHEVILGALRRGDEDAGSLRELLRRRPDWDLVCETACAHGVLPLVYTRLSKTAGDLVPPADMARMKEIHSANGRRNLLFCTELFGILRALAANGIVALPVKGPILAETAYGDIALRMFADLDILVRRCDIVRARELLLERGFLATHAFTARQEKAHLARTCEFTFEKPDRGYHLDLHWRFAADYLAAALDAEAAFGRRVERLVLGRPVQSMADEDTLLFLCLHGTFHLWEKLGLVCDVASFMERCGGFDWAPLTERAAAAGLSRTLQLGITLAGELLGSPVPPGIEAEADRDRAVAALRARACTNLFRTAGARKAGLVESALFQLRSKERSSDKFRYCLIRSLLPTVEDWKRVRLPDALYFLYFVLRPLRLAANALFH